MTESDGGRDTRVVPVKGKSIVVRQLTDMQQMLMLREAKLLQGDADVKRKLDGIERIFNMLESMVIQQMDREFLIDQMVAGELEMADIMGFITAFAPDEEEKPKVRRGRPPRVRV